MMKLILKFQILNLESRTNKKKISIQPQLFRNWDTLLTSEFGSLILFPLSLTIISLNSESKCLHVVLKHFFITLILENLISSFYIVRVHLRFSKKILCALFRSGTSIANSHYNPSINL